MTFYILGEFQTLPTKQNIYLQDITNSGIEKILIKFLYIEIYGFIFCFCGS
jgi:hypothetical protein